MDFYQSLGNLILGSRLRRLSDYYISELNSVYQNQGIEFDTSWFPVFYLLSQNSPLSIKDISDKVGVSHSASSQLISHLKKKGYLVTKTSAEDKRKILVELTPAGSCLLNDILPIWESIKKSMEEIECSNPSISQVLKGLTALEETFNKIKLSEQILRNLENCKSTLNYYKT